MPQISKYPISKEVYERCWEVFTKTLVGIRDREEAQEVINDLFTPTERIMLAKRLATALLLIKGYEYREISRILRVSAPTIAMVNAALKYGNNGYKKALTKILSEEKFNNYFNKAIEVVVSLPAGGGKGSGVWKYLKEEVKEKNRKKPF